MINSDFNAQISPGMRLLSDDQIQEIHSATLELLRRTGVEVLVPEVRDLLKKAGCWLDGERVRIPSHLIEWAVRTAPTRIVLCDRDGNPAMELEGRKGYYGTGSDTPFVLDAYTGERREAVLEDIANVAKLIDALPNLDFLMCMGIASDVTENLSDLYHFRTMVSNTSKPIIYTAWSRPNLEAIIEMAEAIAGGADALQRSPFCALYSEPISPLTHAEESCEKLLFLAKKGLPVVYTPGMMVGATAPVTLAGALVQANAEQLSGLLITQLIREGAPMIGAGGILFMDMSQGLISYAAPEFMLGNTAFAEMCHFYEIPIFAFSGCSDAKVFDQQAAAEGAMWMMLTALGGGNLIHDVGYVESGITASYDQIVAMDEVAGLVKRFMGGVEINEETIALDVIDQVGPGGHYVGEEHTFKHFRHNWRPKLLDRSSRDDWEQAGSLTLGDRANAKVREIFENYQPAPLDEGVMKQLDAVIEKAEEREK
ncbi:MAG: trimethylamine methyltransferase family protein [Anaerolineales bacterium]|nr:trimethylamine methyltransferase family protein [Chloroflexota bacterium]MBL6980101.1 trimethylamine methyltransferase family protein [Anaerolineales bacterium]